MKSPWLIPLLLFAVALPGSAQKREFVELQRDIANLQDQMRNLQRSLDEKMAALTAITQQSLEAANKANTSVTVLDAGIKDRLSEQQRTIATPVANLNSRIDALTSDMSAVREAVADLTNRMGKLQQQMIDLSNSVKTIGSPPPPPGPGGAAMTAPTGRPPVPAKQLYDNAMADRSAGNLDLAMQGFQEYLRYYTDTELAPNAQFYLGQIHYDKNEYPQALTAFDLVLTRYAENNKTPDALYMKGMTLLKSGQKTEAGREFLNVIQQYPKSEVAEKARQQRRALGLSVPANNAAPARRAPARKR